MRTPKIAHPKVFISYAWTSDMYISKVASFAAELQNIGIEVLFDKFETKPGNELNYFMERCVNDETVTNVLLLLNKTYKEKADKREGGVGKETQIISEDIYNKVTQTKFIPVIFEKGENGEIYKPTYLGSTYFVDLCDPKKYDVEFQLLVKTLFGETVYRKPELGSVPEWVTQEVTFPVKKQIEFNSIKQQNNSKIQKLEYKQALDEICKKIIAFRTNDIAGDSTFYEEYVNKYKSTMAIRNEYLQLLTISAYVDDAEKLIASFLEDVFNKSYDNMEQYSEIRRILLHELFIYTIAYFVKNEFFGKAGYLLGKTYFNLRSDPSAKSFDMFRCDYFQTLHDAMRTVKGTQYITGLGALWVEDIYAEYFSVEDFVLADILCFNYSIFVEDKNVSAYWFPTTYIYGQKDYKSALRPWAIKLSSKEFTESVIELFGFDSYDDFIKAFTEIENRCAKGEYRDYRYRESFGCAPLLCHFIKGKEIGQFR